MAGAKSGVHVVRLKPVTVSTSLISGSRFVKWDEGNSVGISVTLRVDPKGYIVFWEDQKGNVDYLDLCQVRDTRTGRHAKVPKEGKLRDSCRCGSDDVPLEDKTLTVVYGDEFVDVQMVHFVSASPEVAREWAHELLSYAVNPLQRHQSGMAILEGIHTKLMCGKRAPDGKIPVKEVEKWFASHKDDRKRVSNALEAAELPSAKGDSISPDQLTFERFFKFYKHLTMREELDRIFNEMGAKKKPYLTADQLMAFLNGEQRDPRLNEILYPPCDAARTKDLVRTYEPNKEFADKGHISPDGLLRYLLSVENDVLMAEKYDLHDDMDQPLCHYFITSSHNTYLVGHQLTGRASVEIYRQCLLAGCRCVELDCWDGSDDEPIITHGFTMCTEVKFREVMEAIAESAFKTSDYPIVLSFENHCVKQQDKLARYCREILADSLLVDPFDSHPLEPGAPLPSPNLLKRKILIKNKKKHMHRPGAKRKSKSAGEPVEPKPASLPEEAKEADTPSRPVSLAADAAAGEDSADESESSSDEEEDTQEVSVEQLKAKQEKGTAASEAAAGTAISALVNYVTPTHFHSFEAAEKKNRGYEISSFVETQALQLLKTKPVEFVNYNKRQMSRIYPKGTRVDSSNYMPQAFWNAGCQLVALNFQSLDLAMQMNLGFFEYNHRCGYVLKPDFMRRVDRRFDPFAESTVDGIVAGTVSVQVLSGQMLTDKRCGVYVEVEMYGLPADTVRKRFRSKTVPNNTINPVFNEEPFVFSKVVLPHLAMIRILLCEETGKLLGHRILPVNGLRPGYRHVALRSEGNVPLSQPMLFVKIVVKDYVPDAMAAFIDALSNPIAYQSELQKREKQLEALIEDDVELPDATRPEQAHPSAEARRTSVVPVAAAAVAAMTRSTSNGGSLQKSAEAAAAMPTPPPKGQFIFTVSLTDSALVEAVDLDLLRKHPAYEKVASKQEKEVAKVKKKQGRVGQMRRSQTDSMLSLHKDQLKQETTILSKYCAPLFDTLGALVKERHEQQRRKLNDVLHRQEMELKRQLDERNKAEKKELAKRHRDKQELSRMKREVQQKHINMAVNEIQKLRELHRAKDEELARRQDETQRELARQREEYERRLTDELKQKCDTLEHEFQ